MKGSIEVICGPMYSGKTSELIRRIKLVEIAHLEHLIIKPQIDDRYSYFEVATHNGITRAAHPVDNIKDVINNLYGVEEVVAIDECQFFTQDIVSVVKYLKDDGVRVIVAGLDMDYRGETFGPMGAIFAIADKIDKLTAICHNCNSFNATQTQKMINGKPAPWENNNVLVGSFEAYEARCKDCWIAPQNPLDQVALFYPRPFN